VALVSNQTDSYLLSSFLKLTLCSRTNYLASKVETSVSILCHPVSCAKGILVAMAILLQMLVAGVVVIK